MRNVAVIGRRVALTILAAGAVLPGALSGQSFPDGSRTEAARSIVFLERAAPRYSPVHPGAPAAPVARPAWADTLALRPTYWKEGAMIGGLTLGVATFALGYAICKDLSESGGCLGYAAGAGAIMTFSGAVIGALIGGGFEKKSREAAAPPDP